MLTEEEKRELRMLEAAEKGLEVGQLEAFARGAFDDLTMDFSDEIIGGAESLLTGKPYKQARDEQRVQSQIAKDQSPGAYYSGTAAGMLGQILSTGGIAALAKVLGKKGAQKFAKKTVLKQAAKGAGQGAVSGAVGSVGRSESESIEGMTKDVATDAIMGASIGGTLGGGGQAAIKGRKVAKYGKEKAIEAVTGLQPEYQKFISKHYPLVKKATDTVGMTDKIIKRANEVSLKTKELSKVADDLLSNSKDPKEAINLNQIKRAISEIKKTIGVKTQDGLVQTSRKSKAAAGYLNTLQKDVNKLDSYMSQKEVKQFIKGLDKDANWNTPGFDERNSVIKKVRRQVDKILKDENPSYREAMIPVAKKSDILDKLGKSFKMKVKKEGDEFIYDATDTTYSKMDRVGSKPRRSKELRSSLKNLGEETGEDLVNESRASYINQVTEGGAAQGSRKVNLGTNIGGVKGAVAGAFLDVAGRKAAKEGLHSGNSLSRKLADSNAVKKLGKFSAPLQNAAKKGQRELAVTHFILSQDPEYLEKIMSEDKE